MRRMVGLAVFLVVLTGGAAALAPVVGASSPPVQPSEIGMFTIKTFQDQNFCLEASSVLDRTVIVSACTGHVNQRTAFTDGTDGRNVIVDGNGKCLDSGNQKPGTLINEEPCTYKGHQKFVYNTSTGLLTVDKAAKKCVAVSKVAQDAAVLVEPCGTHPTLEVFGLGQ